MNDHRIAVIGMSARMPGADSVEEFWRRALSGTVDVHRFTEAELRGAGLSPDLRAAAAGLGDISAFDASFFGLTADRAARTDPQHRIFYEVAHHALEDAGHAAGGGVRTGVYAGAGYDVYPLHGYLRHQLGDVAEEAAADRASSLELAADNASGFLAARTAALLGLSGPAVGVQTGASTGLTAVRLAVAALLDGEADLAIAGASAVHVPQVLGYLPDKGYGLS
ncbi:MAG TPA: beta-ketoacyl synthase N-terminal-like domain-containing protein, partial [Phytomonospora sp.]